jgi:hypothetical protein
MHEVKHLAACLKQGMGLLSLFPGSLTGGVCANFVFKNSILIEAANHKFCL